MKSRPNRSELIATYFLQEVCNTFPFGTPETHRFEELEDILARTLVNDLPLGQENDVVEQVVRLGSWLKQCNEGSSSEDMNGLAEGVDDLVGGGAVETSGDLIHEKRLGWSNKHLTCNTTMRGALLNVFALPLVPLFDSSH